jgi:beta-glucanase (GH16 family)
MIALGLVLILVALGVVRLVDPSIVGQGRRSTTLAPGAAGVPPMTLTWSDEFRGTALDPTRWEESGLWYDKGHYSPDGHGGDLASPSEVKVSGGELVLSATRRTATVNGATYPWVDGFVDTSPNGVQPGFNVKAPFYLEISAKLPPAAPGEWPAIAMYQSPVNGAAQYAEMDLLERVRVPATAYMSFHPAGSAPGFANQIGQPGVDLSSRFHSYGIYVDTSGSIQYYFDKSKVGRAIPGGANASEPMFLSVGMTMGGVANDGWAGVPTAATPNRVEMLVDYVRVWQ